MMLATYSGVSGKVANIASEQVANFTSEQVANFTSERVANFDWNRWPTCPGIRILGDGQGKDLEAEVVARTEEGAEAGEEAIKK